MSTMMFDIMAVVKVGSREMRVCRGMHRGEEGT